MGKPQHGYGIMTLWSLVSVYSDYQWRRVEHWPLGRRAMIGRVIQTMRTPRYKARPLICFITLQLLLCQVARALQLALCHLASPRPFAQYAAALQAQQARQAAALSAPEPSRVVQPLQFVNAAPAEAPATAENEVCTHF